MKICLAEYEKEHILKLRIYGGTSSKSYRIPGNKVLKIFLDNEVFDLVLNEHNNDFLSYLIELSKIKNDALLIPRIVHINEDESVSSYIHQYLKGVTVRNIPGKTSLDEIIDATSEFYANICRLENFGLKDIHPNNVMYVKDKKKHKKMFKIIDLDRCNFFDTDQRQLNIRKLDKTLFRSLFGLNYSYDPYVVDKNLSPLYDSMFKQEINLIDFLREYRDYIRKEYGECEQVKHLNRGLIVNEFSRNTK